MNIRLDLLEVYNLHHSSHALKCFLASDKCLGERDADLSKGEVGDVARYFTYNLNDLMDYAVWDGSVLRILANNRIMKPWEVLCHYNHDGSITRAVYDIELLIKKRNIPYARVGDEYFSVDDSGKYLPFSKVEIKEDYGKGVLDHIRKYSGFDFEPSNIDYRSVTRDNCINTYNEPLWVADDSDSIISIDDDCIKWSMVMMRHIFGNQLEFGLEYMKLLWEMPKQMLPVLVLASAERQTGKTTFGNWVGAIKGRNYTTMSVEQMKGNFNAHFAEKIVIVVEETEDESKSFVNKIKGLSTTKTLIVNEKHQRAYDVNFYGKFIILTNSPDKFLMVDREEIRFWVRSVPTLNGSANHNIEEDLISEIPMFLKFLGQVSLGEKRSRMWFSQEDIYTESLGRVMKESENAVVKELKRWFLDNGSELGREELYFNVTDIKKVLFPDNNRHTPSVIKKEVNKLVADGFFNSSGDRKFRYVSGINDFDTNSRIGRCFWKSYDLGDDSEVKDGNVSF
mgnify:CR=1 FL=1|tara:strand:+ start:154 stop:1680 length:1527 start_codon:yes stop_codon:yes gene_type:complete